MFRRNQKNDGHKEYTKVQLYDDDSEDNKNVST